MVIYWPTSYITKERKFQYGNYQNTHKKPTRDIILTGLPQYTLLQIMDFNINSGSGMEAQKRWRDFSNFI